MKTCSLAKVAFVSILVLFTTVLQAQSKVDSVAVQTIIQGEVAAWNKGDALAYAQSFAQDGTFTNVAGMFFTGQKAFMERHDQIFKGMFSKTVLQQKIVSFRFLDSNVAIVETLSQVSGFSGSPLPGTYLDAKGRLNTRLLQVIVKQANDWKIVAYHNIDLKPGIPVPEPE